MFFKKMSPKCNLHKPPIFWDCVCKYGWNGDGKDFCDECGLHYFENNARIFGGIDAVSHSWPSIVQIKSSYKTLVNLDGNEILIQIDFICGGSLLNRRTVLTAAHCILHQFDYVYNNHSYLIKVTENEYNPTLESIYKVYVGAKSLILTDTDLKPAQVFNVAQIIRVEFKNSN